MAKITIDPLKVCSVVPVKRASATLLFLAEAVDQITEVGESGLDGGAALGFANIVRSVGEDLAKLTSPADASAAKGQGEGRG